MLQLQHQDYVQAPYLSALKNFRRRRLVSRFRCGCHRLHVDTGQFKPVEQRVDREQRFCPVCETDTAEDEHHFVFDCPDTAQAGHAVIQAHCRSARPRPRSYSTLGGEAWFEAGSDQAAAKGGCHAPIAEVCHTDCRCHGCFDLLPAHCMPLPEHR